ncbi:hypothetical protein EC9_00570 [Rosistilla ulvae]|uniref:Uncharacterized protein n=1 Tax=Rosistilla ulvae TaxID=1930277 RepID=A0A517LTE9_9BACT|nr:hypothetical protein EC9_00570 [Rosistilla ulvae]
MLVREPSGDSADQEPLGTGALDNRKVAAANGLMKKNRRWASGLMRREPQTSKCAGAEPIPSHEDRWNAMAADWPASLRS